MTVAGGVLVCKWNCPPPPRNKSQYWETSLGKTSCSQHSPGPFIRLSNSSEHLLGRAIHSLRDTSRAEQVLGDSPSSSTEPL